MNRNAVEARTIDFKPGERNIFFHILTACNLSCRHCYINKKQHGTKTLEKELIEKWLVLFATPEKQANLIILGGEPTLHRDLPNIIRTAKKLNYTVTVDSNGFLFYDFLEKIAPTELDFLSFSLDGPNREINDAIRGEGVFAVCTANIKRAIAKGFNVSIIYTVNAYNIEALQHMLPLLSELKVRRFFIQVVGLRGNSVKYDNAKFGQVTRKQWGKVIPEVAKKIAEQGIQVVYPKVFLERHEKFECAANVADNFFIFPNGRVYRCPLCEDYPINAYRMSGDRLKKNSGLREDMFFPLNIPEGCIMNRLFQPATIEYDNSGKPLYRISCCLLKSQIDGC